MLPTPATLLKEQPSHSSATHSTARHSHKRASVAATTTAGTANISSGLSGTRSSPPHLINRGTGGASPTGANGGTSSSTGCVRWCMNVALQSFAGEPWAVTLQPAAEDETVMNGSFHCTPAERSITPPTSVPLHTPATTTTQAANSVRQQPYQQSQHQHGQRSPIGTPRGSGGTSPVHGGVGTRMSPSMLRSGLQLAAIDYSDPQPLYPGGPALDAAAIGYDPSSEECFALQQCITAVNSPPITFGVDDLLGRITNVEFVAEPAGPEDSTVRMPVLYRLTSSLEPLLNATLHPAITAVVDHCVSSMVLVYGATQEMKQMGLIGTPEECGLLPYGIRSMMERFLERREQQLSKSTNNGGGSGGSRTSADKTAGTSSIQRRGSGGNGSSASGEDAVFDGDRTEGVHSRSATSPTSSFVFPSIGSRLHKFVRMEVTFIAFDSTSIVDLLDVSNRHVELVLKLASPPTPSAFDEKTDDGSSSSSSSATTDSFVLNARAMPVESTNDALSALDIGLENLSRVLELALLQSESGSSLLFSLTAFTDTCRSATMHVLCLAEDPAAQTWLASTVQARSQAIPIGEEQSWASIQNTPMPPPLHHHAATMLVPSLCFGNIFTSILICVYNSVAALGRLNRDLTLAVTGYRMRTIPRVTLASSRKGLKKLPLGWEEYFTNDGRRYFIDTTTQTTTWADPRLSTTRSSRSGTLTSSSSSGSTKERRSASGRSGGQQHRPSRVGLGVGDKDFLANRLQQELHGGGSSGTSNAQVSTSESVKGLPQQGPLSSSAAAWHDEAVDIGIVVVDPLCRPRVLLDSHSPQFAQQYQEEVTALRAKQRELEEASKKIQRQAKMAAKSRSASSAAPATAPVGEGAQVATDSAAPTAQTDADGIPLSPSNGLFDLGDVEDEEVSSLWRSSSTNIDDFIFDDNSDDDTDTDGEQERAEDQVIRPSNLVPPVRRAEQRTETDAAGAPHHVGEASVQPQPQDCDAANAEARFYANALQEQAVGVAEMSAVGVTVTATPSMTGTPSIGASTVCPGEGEGGAADASRVPCRLTAVPPEVQDLESLVDEFTAFYRKAFALQRRVKQLEEERAELKRHGEATEGTSLLHATPSSPTVGSIAEAQADAIPSLAHSMLQAVEASPSKEVQAVLAPLLRSAASASGTTASTSHVLEAFQEALRLATQKARE